MDGDTLLRYELGEGRGGTERDRVRGKEFYFREWMGCVALARCGGGEWEGRRRGMQNKRERMGGGGNKQETGG